MCATPRSAGEGCTYFFIYIFFIPFLFSLRSYESESPSGFCSERSLRSYKYKTKTKCNPGAKNKNETKTNRKQLRRKNRKTITNKKKKRKKKKQQQQNHTKKHQGAVEGVLGQWSWWWGEGGREWGVYVIAEDSL